MEWAGITISRFRMVPCRSSQAFILSGIEGPTGRVISSITPVRPIQAPTGPSLCTTMGPLAVTRQSGLDSPAMGSPGPGMMQTAMARPIRYSKAPTLTGTGTKTT